MKTLNNLFRRINIARFSLHNPHNRKRDEANQKMSINMILKRYIHRAGLQNPLSNPESLLNLPQTPVSINYFNIRHIQFTGDNRIVAIILGLFMDSF